MIIAAINERKDEIKALIETKADVNIIDKNGKTDLSFSKYPFIINLLNKAGAK